MWMCFVNWSLSDSQTQGLTAQPQPPITRLLKTATASARRTYFNQVLVEAVWPECLFLTFSSYFILRADFSRASSVKEPK